MPAPPFTPSLWSSVSPCSHSRASAIELASPTDHPGYLQCKQRTMVSIPGQGPAPMLVPQLGFEPSSSVPAQVTTPGPGWAVPR